MFEMSDRILKIYYIINQFVTGKLENLEKEIQLLKT